MKFSLMCQENIAKQKWNKDVQPVGGAIQSVVHATVQSIADTILIAIKPPGNVIAK